MYNHGDAAEQVMRMTLQGVEMTAKISGHAAKNIALLLIAIAKEQEKTKGKTRLSSMLKSGKPLKVFTIRESDLKDFTREAKRYGVLYCALRGKAKSPDGQVDIMAPVEDAPKINRIVKRFHFATIDTAAITTEIEKSRKAPEKETVDEKKLDDLAGDLLGKSTKKEQNSNENPFSAKTKNPQSEPTSKTQKSVERGTSNKQKPSVKKEMDDIRKSRETAKNQTVKNKEILDNAKKKPITKDSMERN